MLWKRVSGPGGFFCGDTVSIGMWVLVKTDHSALRYVALSANACDMSENMYRALWSWIICVLVTVTIGYAT
jgi:SSS family solute:Na+ symporter